MTESQLDQMLGLCEIGIEKAYRKPVLWCTCHMDRLRRATGERISHFQVIYGFAGDDEVYSVAADSLSDLLGQIVRRAVPAVSTTSAFAGGGRRVVFSRDHAVRL